MVEYIIVILIIFAIIKFKRKKKSKRKKVSAKIKGKRGEVIVKEMLRNLQRPGEFILSDVILSGGNTTHQIDHIFISKKGIFVIEVKNYSGLIYGEEYQKEWTQVLGRGIREKFYNPIKQNATHVRVLNDVLDYGNFDINNIVIFVNGNLKNKNNHSVFTPNTFGIFYRSLPDKYDAFQLSIMNETICSKKSQISNEEHVENVKTLMSNINNNICPRCNSTLVLKEGKYGPYMRCSNYPQCRFTKNSISTNEYR